VITSEGEEFVANYVPFHKQLLENKLLNLDYLQVKPSLQTYQVYSHWAEIDVKSVVAKK